MLKILSQDESEILLSRDFIHHVSIHDIFIRFSITHRICIYAHFILNGKNSTLHLFIKSRIIVLLKSLRNCRRLNKGNFTLSHLI